MTKLYLTRWTDTQWGVTMPAPLGTWDRTADLAAADKTMLSPAGYDVGGADPVDGEGKSCSETDAASGYRALATMGISPELAAQTISGDLDAVILGIESASAADAALSLHVWVRASDGTNRGTLLANYSDPSAREIGTTVRGNGLNAPQAMTPVDAQLGDRVVIEIGAIFYNSVTTSYSVTLYNGTNTRTPTDAVHGTSYASTNFTVATWFDFLSGLTLVKPKLRVTTVNVDVLHNPDVPEPPAPSAGRTQIVVAG